MGARLRLTLAPPCTVAVAARGGGARGALARALLLAARGALDAVVGSYAGLSVVDAKDGDAGEGAEFDPSTASGAVPDDDSEDDDEDGGADDDDDDENDESALTPGADDPSARLPYRCPPIGDGYDASEDGAPPDDDAAVDDEDDLVVVKHPRRVSAARVLKRLFG